MGYVTVAVMKNYLGERIGTVNDTLLGSFIDQASTAVDLATGRFFDTKTNRTLYADTHRGDAARRRLLLRNDILNITSLSIDSDRSGAYATDVPANDYRMYPLDASLKGHPHDEIRMVMDTFFPPPSLYPSVKIVGDFGWENTPAPIIGAVEIIVSRLVARINAPLGASGSPDSPLGVSQVMGDPELALLVQDYIMPV